MAAGAAAGLPLSGLGPRCGAGAAHPRSCGRRSRRERAQVRGTAPAGSDVRISAVRGYRASPLLPASPVTVFPLKSYYAVTGSSLLHSGICSWAWKVLGRKGSLGRAGLLLKQSCKRRLSLRHRVPGALRGAFGSLSAPEREGRNWHTVTPES